ncbi:MAG TPA: PhzF family phenazine biosynthesis protein [Allosphingosinicella sp.]
MKLSITQVDAFADGPFTGNPAAVMPLEEWLPDETMQKIAMENNLAETAFTVPAQDDADYELRWFTPTVEVAFCGHATLASGHVLMEDRERVRFRTRKSGLFEVIARDGAGLELDVPQTLVRPATADQLQEARSKDGTGLLDIIGHDGASEADKGEPFLSCSGAEATAILLLPDAAAVRKCAPDMARLREIELMVIVTAQGGSGEGHDVVSRVFVPAWGVDEDPVTGSAHAALTPFWCDRLGRESFTAWQASRRGGRVECRRKGDRAILGGKCVTVMEGVMSF